MNDGDRSSLESPYPPLGHFRPEVEGLETERYDGRYRRAFARRQPSPSGRGQGEGSDVNPSSSVIGAGARNADLRLTVISPLLWKSARRSLRARESSSLRAGASPSQNGIVGGAPWASATRTVPAVTCVICQELLPSWKMSPALLSMAKSSFSVPMKVSSPSSTTR